MWHGSGQQGGQDDLADTAAPGNIHWEVLRALDEGYCRIQLIVDDAGQPVDYRFLEVNPAFTRQTGLTDVVGRTARELVPGLDGFWFETYGRVACTGEPVRMDQEAPAMGRWFSVYAFRLGAPQERQVGVLFSDITRRRAAEAELRRSEQRFRQAQEAGRVGVWEWNVDTGHTYWSDTMWAIYGHEPTAEADPEDLFRSAVLPEDLPGLDAELQHCLSGRTPEFQSVFRIQRPDGSLRWIEARAQPTWREGRPRFLSGVNLDVTERVQATSRLLASEERFRTMADGLPLIVWVHDARGALRFVNATYCEFFGVTSEQVTGSGWMPLVHKDDAAAYAAEFLCCVRERRAFHATVRVRDALGRWRHIESWARPQFASDGEFLGHVGTSADITERIQAEEAARRSALLVREAAEAADAERVTLRTIMQTMTEALAMFDADGRVIAANPAFARMHGVSPDAVVGMDLADFEQAYCVRHADGRPFAVEDWPIVRALHGETVHNLEMHVRHPGADKDWVALYSAAPVLDAQGRARAAVITIADITEMKRAEQELLPNRELLLSILDNAEAAIYAKDAQGRFLLSNRHHAALLGRPAHEVIGKTDADFVADSATLALCRAQDQAVLAHSRAMEFEDTVQGADGPRAYASIKFPLRDAGGRVYGVCTLSTDVTERRRAAEAYREKAEELERLMQVTPVGIWVSYDPQCRRVNGNRMANAIFEAEAHENLSESRPKEAGTPRRRFFAADGRELLPNDLPMQQAVARDEDVHDQEITVLLPSGRRTLLCSATPLRDAAHQVRGCLCTGLDITDRVAVEHALRESESKLRALADNMAQLAWMADEQGMAFWFNLQWFDFSGLTPLAANGEGWLHLVHPDHRQRVAQGIRRHAAEGRIWEDSFPLLRCDDEYRWMLSRATPIRDADGRVYRWFGTHTDITAQRAAEEALKEADRRKDDFLAMLAHELRNPLAPVRNAVELIRRSGNAPATVERARDMIERQVSHMTRLIDDLLDVSRIAKGKIQLRMDRCDLAELMRQTAQDLRPSVEGAGIELAVTVPDAPLWVHGDRTRLAQMVGNLLHNAIKFTDAGGCVELRLHADAATGRARLVVEDSGIGMEPDFMRQLFQPFTQADRSIDRSRGGLGLGLALVKGLAELHGGEVQVHSSGAGRGSRFTISLPLDRSQPAVPPPPPADAPAASPAPSSRRILVIEDNADVAESLEALLSLCGHQVSVAPDGRVGIAQALQAPPDVVLCDLGLPGGLDGYAVARELRRLLGGRIARLVALSGYGTAEDQRLAHEAGFDLHLTKPVDYSALETLIAELPQMAREGA
ncbi:MAG: PAS domain S-box protein [Pseudomonadota bacterium]